MQTFKLNSNPVVMKNNKFNILPRLSKEDYEQEYNVAIVVEV